MSLHICQKPEIYNPNVNYGLQLVITCQYWFINFNNSHKTQIIGKLWEMVYENTRYLFISSSVNLKLL